MSRYHTMLARTAAALGLALALAGCKGTPDEKPEPGGTAAEPGGAAAPEPPELISASEAQTGRDACKAYSEQVCRCAGQEGMAEELRSGCEMSSSRLEALELNLRAAVAEGDATAEDRRAVAANARKIVRGCIEDASALAARGCPLGTGKVGEETPPTQTGEATPGEATPPSTETPAPARPR